MGRCSGSLPLREAQLAGVCWSRKATTAGEGYEGVLAKARLTVATIGLQAGLSWPWQQALRIQSCRESSPFPEEVARQRAR